MSNILKIVLSTGINIVFICMIFFPVIIIIIINSIIYPKQTMPLLITFDQMLNVLFKHTLNHVGNTDLFGDPDETISSVMGKIKPQGNKWVRYICLLLHFVDKHHCVESIEADENVQPKNKT